MQSASVCVFIYICNIYSIYIYIERPEREQARERECVREREIDR